MNKLRISEKEYRSMDIDSYSSISQFLTDRKKYYRKYIQKVKDDDEELIQSLKMGSLVDTLSLPDENGKNDFDEKFIVSKVTDIPTGQMLSFCNHVYGSFKSAANIVNGTSSTNIISAKEIYHKCTTDVYDKTLQVAYNAVGFKRESLESVVKKFEKYSPYFNQLLESGDKIVVTKDDLTKASKIQATLDNSSNTGPIMLLTTNERFTVINQLIILFSYNNYPLKCMLDKVVIDHEKKVIQPYDLKTSFSVEEFSDSYYKYKYYIQAAVYWTGLYRWAEDQGYIEKGYRVEYMKFIVCDTNLYLKPLIYTTTEEHFAEGIGGFYGKNNVFYPGLNQALEELEWHKNTNIWNISKNNFDSEGIVEVSRSK